MSTPRNFQGRGRPRLPRVRSIATLCLMLAAVGLIWAATASQAAGACPIPGGFEIDGDMNQATCAPAGDDWDTPGLVVAQSSQVGTYQTAFKDDSDPSTWKSSGATPDKTDFQQAYATSRVTNNDFFTYVAWERSSTTGTQGYAIEVTNAPPRTAADGTPRPDRSQGGVVFYLSSQGAAAPAFDGECKYTSQADYGSTCDNLTTNFTAAINSGAIVDPFTMATQPAGSFFEVALNITGLTGIQPSCPGATAATVYLRSITGQTSNGNLKGYMSPLSVAPNSTCVPPAISTTANPGGSLNPPGTPQTDSVTVGTQAIPAIGSVKFFLCSPSQVAANGGDCKANGTQVGAAVTLDANGQGTSAPPVDGSSTPNDKSNGKYCWRAEFTPSPNDTHYLPASETNSLANGAAGDECFVIVHNSPTISTQIAVTGNPPALGLTTLGDSAQLSGFAGSVTGETITFRLYGPFAGAVPADCTAGGAVFHTTGTLDASGKATGSGTFTPTAAGTYIWIASYPGDPLNRQVIGQCTDANESATIVASQITLTKAANPAGPVSAGDTIGFDITVTNPGTVPALGVTVHDVLPSGADGVAGGDLDWSLVPAYPGCTISGAVGSQVLDCSFNQVDPGSLPPIHISSATSPADCGVVKNKASATTTNGTGGDSNDATVAVQCPAVTLTKTADNATVSAGDQIGFVITATNSSAPGTGTAKDVVLDDPLPAGAGVDWSITPAGVPANCSIIGAVGAQTLHCTAVDLAPGASETVHVVSATEFASCATYQNQVTLTASNNGQLQASDSTTVQCPDLSITKTADHVNPVNAGDPVGFTITVGNSAAPGTGIARGATLDDPLPAGTAADWTIDPAYAGPGTCTITGALGSQTLDCSFGDLAPGDTATVHVTSPTSFAACGIYDNTATASATNQPNVTASATEECRPSQVSITKKADHSAPVHAGDTIGFTVEVKNTARGTATGVVLNDPLPKGSGSGVTWAIDTSVGTPAQFVLSGPAGSQTLSLASGTLPGGADYTVHITAQTSQTECSTYDNTATLTTGNANDPNPVSAKESCAFRVDLSITKSGAPNPLTLGTGNITWTIVVTNNGPDVDTGVKISDPMPAGNTFVSATSTQGTCTGGAILNCNIGTMAAGASVTITLVTTPSTTGNQDNTVTVAGDRPETNTTNNQATATVLVVGPATPPVFCVAVSKVTPKQLFVGRKTKLTIHLTQDNKAVAGIKVRIKGPKLNLTTGRSNSKGVITKTVKLKKAGIMVFSPIASKRCNTKRIGVTGVFTPPVTG